MDSLQVLIGVILIVCKYNRKIRHKINNAEFKSHVQIKLVYFNRFNFSKKCSEICKENVWLFNDVLMDIVSRQTVTAASETGVADHKRC